MSRYSILAVLLLFSMTCGVFAQEGEAPIFGGGKKDEKSKTDQKAKEPQKPVKKLTAEEKLIEDLARWPGQEALATARELISKGPRIVPILTKNLENNDWRIRCGCAYALGELKEQSAFPQLQKAIRDIANRISLGPFFDAMSKIDEKSATSEILPFVASPDARAAKAAMSALPEVIDQKFEARVVALTTHRENAVRFRALDLLSRLKKPVAPEVYINLLKDRAPRVANSAAKILAASGDQKVYDALKDLVLSGSLRASSYALISLVMAEDQSNRVLLSEEKALKKRLMVLLRIRGELENATAAIALANMSMHSADPSLRKFADGPLMEYLLVAAGGGTIFKDYISVKDLCLKKAALITGENFGDNTRMWVDWWQKNRDGFKARRELTTVSVDDAAEVRVRLARRKGDDVFHLELIAGKPKADDLQVRRPMFVDLETMKSLIKKLNDGKVMATRGMKFNPDWAGDYIELRVLNRSSEFLRVHYDDVPEDLGVFAKELEQVALARLWQLFWNRDDAPDFAQWFEAKSKFYAGLEGAQRTEALADQALDAFAQLDPRSRRAAVRAFKAAGADWVTARKDRFLTKLDRNSLRLDSSKEILDTLASVPGKDVLDRVIDFLPLFTDEGAQILATFIAKRPLDEILNHDDGNRPDVRVALVPFYAQKMGESRAALLKLIEFMSDVDPRVRDALTKTLKENPNKDLMAELETRMSDPQNKDRLSLIELYGSIGGDQVVAKLQELYADGSQPMRVSVINALKRAGNDQAVDALLRVAQEDKVAFYRIESMSALADLDREDVRTKIRTMLGQQMTPQRLREMMPVCAEIFRRSLESDFVRFLSHDDETIRKEAALLLGPLGIKAAFQELTGLLLDETEANRAWEYLELITCHEVITPGGEEALAAYREWYKEHKKEEQHEWFMAAMKAEGLPAQHLLGYLEGKKRPYRAIALLIRALDAEPWFIRVNASNYLTRIRGSKLAHIDRRSTPEQLAKARNRWSEWYKALLEGF